jgi:hypothetical protein
MDALRRSLGQASSSPGKPAKKSRKASSGQKEIADAHRGQEGRQANGGQETCVQAAAQVGLALQLCFSWISESMGNHDSNVVGTGRIC